MEYIKKFKTAIMFLFFGGLITLLIMAKLVLPKIKIMVYTQKQIGFKKEALADYQRKIDYYKGQVEAKRASGQIVDVKLFYHPIESGADTEIIMSKELEEFLSILKRHRIKARSFNYVYDSPDDIFVKNEPAKYSSCMITMDIISDYRQFLNFLKDLYQHKHFTNISKIEIIPYKVNKRVLLINLQVALYAQKGR